MLSIKQVFELCVKAVQTPHNPADGKAPITPTDSQRLGLYAAYKQATLGDCSRPAPWMWQIVEYKKWQAWTQLKGMSTQKAQLSYIKQVQDLMPKQSSSIGGSSGKMLKELQNALALFANKS